jgi:hypothetical protein
MSTLAAATINSPGGGIGDVMGMGDINTYLVPFTVNMSSSYATGGDTWTPPPGIPGNWKLRQIKITGHIQSGYIFSWNSSVATPKIQAFTGANSPEPVTGTFPAIATAGNDGTYYTLTAPFSGTVSAAYIAANATYTGATPNGRNWTVQNITQSFTDVATFTGTGSGAAFNLAAGTPKAMTLGAAAHLVVTAGDQINFVSTHTGTGLADPGGTFSLLITPSSGGANEVPATTNLSAITLSGVAYYGA